MTSIGLIWHPVKLIELLGGAKDEHFSCFHSSCQGGLRAYCRNINTVAMRRCAVSLPMQSYFIYKSYIYYAVYIQTYIDRSFTLLLLLTLHTKVFG